MEAEFQESVSHRLEKGYLLPGQAKLMCSTAELVAKLNRRGCVAVSLMEPQKGEWNIRDEFGVTVKSVNSYNNQFPLLVKDLKSWKKRVTVLYWRVRRGRGRSIWRRTCRMRRFRPSTARMRSVF